MNKAAASIFRDEANQVWKLVGCTEVVRDHTRKMKKTISQSEPQMV